MKALWNDQYWAAAHNYNDIELDGPGLSGEYVHFTPDGLEIHHPEHGKLENPPDWMVEQGRALLAVREGAAIVLGEIPHINGWFQVELEY